MDELQAALSARGLTLSSIPVKGRGLVATRDFAPGDVIIYQEPYASSASKTSGGPFCDGCFVSNSLRKCSACRVAWYCGNMCQRSEWKLHQLECQALAALSDNRKKMLTPSIRLMMRLLLKRKLQEEQIISTTATDDYRLVEALVSHMSEISEEQLVVYVQMANLVSLVLPFLEVNLKEVTENFSKEFKENGGAKTCPKPDKYYQEDLICHESEKKDRRQQQNQRLELWKKRLAVEEVSAGCWPWRQDGDGDGGSEVIGGEDRTDGGWMETAAGRSRGENGDGDNGGWNSAAGRNATVGGWKETAAGRSRGGVGGLRQQRRRSRRASVRRW